LHKQTTYLFFHTLNLFRLKSKENRNEIVWERHLRSLQLVLVQWITGLDACIIYVYVCMHVLRKDKKSKTRFGYFRVVRQHLYTKHLFADKQ